MTEDPKAEDHKQPKGRSPWVFVLPLIAFLVFGVMAGIGLYGQISGSAHSDQAASVLVGKAAPGLPVSALSDDLAKPLSAFKGQPVLVNIMASWCAPCKAELPALALLSKEVPVIAIAYKDRAEDTARFLTDYGNPFEAVWMDYDGSASMQWGIYGVPETFLLDREGRIVMRHAGPIFKDVLEDVIRPALAELAPSS